jgi:hypothetical protein
MRRARAQVAFAVLFAVLTLNAWVQVVFVALGRSDDPPALMALQTLVGATAAGAAWGSWTSARWAPAVALLYGIVTGAMLLSLGPLLALEPQARGGLWTGAAAVFAFALGSAWYLRRRTMDRSRSA